MIKVVIDTNVFVSGTIGSSGSPAKILSLWRNNLIEIVTSRSLIQEVDRVLHYPHIKEKYQLTETEIKAVVLELETQSTLTSEKIKLEVIKDDPDDNKLVEAAVEGEAIYIISGDRHLKKLKSYQGIKVITPADFIQLFKIT